MASGFFIEIFSISSNKYAWKDQGLWRDLNYRNSYRTGIFSWPLCDRRCCRRRKSYISIWIWACRLARTSGPSSRFLLRNWTTSGWTPLNWVWKTMRTPKTCADSSRWQPATPAPAPSGYRSQRGDCSFLCIPNGKNWLRPATGDRVIVEGISFYCYYCSGCNWCNF
jgi:hypothetical protein